MMCQKYVVVPNVLNGISVQKRNTYPIIRFFHIKS